MLEGLFSAAAGMAAQQLQLDAVSNDLANVNTDGYKSERVGFEDLLYNRVDKAGTETTAGAGAAARILGRSSTQGALKETGNPLDLAIEGEGFLQLRRPGGSTVLTRNGALQLNANGEISDAAGNLLEPADQSPGRRRRLGTADRLRRHRRGAGQTARADLARHGHRARPPDPRRRRSARAERRQRRGPRGVGRARPPGRARGLQRRPRARHGDDDDRPARLPDEQHGDPDREPDDGDREPAEGMSAPGSEPVGAGRAGVPRRSSQSRRGSATAPRRCSASTRSGSSSNACSFSSLRAR